MRRAATSAVAALPARVTLIARIGHLAVGPRGFVQVQDVVHRDCPNPEDVDGQLLLPGGGDAACRPCPPLWGPAGMTAGSHVKQVGAARRGSRAPSRKSCLLCRTAPA